MTMSWYHKKKNKREKILQKLTRGKRCVKKTVAPMILANNCFLHKRILNKKLRLELL